MRKRLLYVAILVVAVLGMAACSGSAAPLDAGIVDRETGNTVELGMRRDDVEELFDDFEPEPEASVVYYEGIYVSYDEDDLVRGIRLTHHVKETWQISSGITIGASRADVNEAYGTPHEEDGRGLCKYDNGEISLLIHVEDDAVDIISIGRSVK